MNAIMDTVKRHNRAGLIGILVIFLALSAALVLLLISLITDELGAQRLERQGVELLVAIKPLQRQIAEHRGACAASASGGAPSYRARCLAAGQAIDASFARLATLKLQLDGAHDLREDISSLAQWWQRLKAQTPALAPDAVIKTHRLLIDEVIELIHSIADRSGLITDSAYDTHYMQEIAVVQLPDYLDRVGYVRVLATRLALAGQSDAASHGVLAAQIEQLRKVDEVLQHASGDIAEIDPLLGRTFSRLAAATTWQTAMFIGLVESRALTGQALDSEDADALFNAGGQALAAGHRLDEVAMHDLRQRLDQRIAQDEQMLLAAGIISVLAVVLVLYIFRRFFVSLTQLEQGEARLEAIFDAATDALVVIDGDGKILQFNHAAETIFGYPSAEVVGNSVNMLMPETLRGPHDGYLSRFQGGTQRTIREIHGLRKDGTAFPLELSISGALVNKRSIFIGIGRDITARKKMELELVTQQHLISIINRIQSSFIAGGDPREFFESLLPDILTLTGSEFGFIAEAVTAADGTRYARSLAVSDIAWDQASRTFYDQHKEQGLEFRNPATLFGRVIMTGQPVISNDPAHDPHSGGLPGGHPPLETFLGLPLLLGPRLVGIIGLANRRGGYDQAVIERLQPLLSTCAQLISAIGSERDKKAAALALKRSNSFMTALVENMQRGVLVEDELGKIHVVNQTYCDLFDKAEMPLMIEGESAAQQFEDNRLLFADAAAFLQLRHDCMAGQRVVSSAELALADGRFFEQDYVPVIVEDEQGNVHRRHLWAFRDVSERKQVQLRLQQAKEAAEAAALAKSQFLATMSHEIRTPMNGVLGMLHLLSRSELDDKQRRHVATAVGSGELLLTVINDILDFSKLEAGKVELETIPFDLVTLLEQTVALQAKGAHEKRLELLTVIDPAVPSRVNGDPTRLRQILTNLISNAIKFTGRGEVVVYAQPAPGNRICFGVRDTGIGISDEQRQRLFQAFSQVDSSHTRKYGGTGLGLAICQRLVATMGGEISVVSSPGAGTDFSFELPLETASDDEGTQMRVSALLSSQRVLVVDDNPYVRNLLRAVLKSWQVVKIGVAEGGRDALQQLRAAATAGVPYDIALLDVVMPDINGLELARRIRSEPALNGMLLVMVSAVEQPGPEPAVNGWLAKPLRRSELYNTLVQLIGGQSPVSTELAPASSPAGGWWFNGSRLLLVEDNLVNQQVASEILGEAGLTVEVRENGAEALQAVQQHDYAVVLMDIQMPVMDGLEATRQIRALGGRFATLPILAMTAHALDGESDKSFAAGMNGHLTKPIDPEAVFRELARWITPGEKPPQATAVTAPSAVDDGPPSALPGIDLADGLARLNGNWASYKRILQGFHKQQADAAARLEQQLRAGEWDEATRLAHTLKGSGGNLGATGLYHSAAALEQACRRREVTVGDATFEALRASLTEVMAGLQALNNNAGVAAGAARAVDPQTWQTLLDQVLECLDSDLGQAQDRLAALQQQVAGSGYAAGAGELEQALNGFDIDAAKAIIERLRAA